MKLCWIYRQGISWAADAGGPPPRWSRQHVAACAACQRFQKTESTLAAELTRTASAGVVEPPSFLHNGVVCALNRPARRLVPPAPFFCRIRRLFVPLAAALLLMAFGIWQAANHRSPESSFTEVDPEIEAPPMPASRQVELLAWAEQLDQPLETELSSVVSDARNALQSLSENFLPSNLLAKNEF